MTVDAFLARMRVRQAELFSSTVTVTRRATVGSFNETTASWSAPSETTVYTGAALVRPMTATVDEAGRTSTAIDTYVVKLPVDTAVHVGDVVTVTASTFDAGLVGVTLRVIDVPVDEWQVCRRATPVRQTERPT